MATNSNTPDQWTEPLARLYVRGFASIAALSCVRNRSSDELLVNLLESYLSAAKSQLRRLRTLAGDASIERCTSEPPEGIEELRVFASEIARGLLAGGFDSIAAGALMRLAVNKHTRYEAALDALPADASEAELALSACLAEEAAAIETLERYQFASGMTVPAQQSA